MRREPVRPDDEMSDRQHGYLATMVGDGEYWRCDHCGRQFVPEYRTARYCSRVCRGRAGNLRRGKR